MAKNQRYNLVACPVIDEYNLLGVIFWGANSETGQKWSVVFLSKVIRRTGFIPRSLLQTIRRQVDRANSIENDQRDELRAGEIVAITSGPLVGYHAIFDSYLPGHKRACALLQMLQGRPICVELSKKQLERIQ